MGRDVAIACTLSAQRQSERVADWRRVLDGARREPIGGGLRFWLPAERMVAVAELSAAELECCAFFTFTLRLDVDGLRFDLQAPADSAPLLADVFEPLAG